MVAAVDLECGVVGVHHFDRGRDRVLCPSHTHTLTRRFQHLERGVIGVHDFDRGRERVHPARPVPPVVVLVPFAEGELLWGLGMRVRSLELRV